MSDFDNNNQNNNENNDNKENINQDQCNKVPDYSFRAEQAPGNSYSNYNTNNNYGTTSDYNHNLNYNNNPNYNPNYHTGETPYNNVGSDADAQNKKKSSSGSKVVKFVAKAVCFGLIAGMSFLGFQKIYYSFNPDAESKSLLENKSAVNYEVGNTETGTVKRVAASTISDVTDATLPAIVSINSTSTQTTQWFGQSF